MYFRFAYQGLLYPEVCVIQLNSHCANLYRYSRTKGNMLKDPVGYEELPGVIKIEDVVRSSVAYYKQFGLQEQGKPAPNVLHDFLKRTTTADSGET